MPERGIVSGLEDRVVIVTGAAGGVGREIVALFDEAGARVLAVDVAQEPLDALLGGLPEPGRHRAVAADLTELAGHAGLVRRRSSAGCTRSSTPPPCCAAAPRSTTSPRTTGTPRSTRTSRPRSSSTAPSPRR